MTTHTPTLDTVGAAAPAAGRTVRRRSGMRPWALFMVIVIVAFFGLILSRIALDRSAFVLDTLDDQIAEAQTEHFDLRVQVAELRDPQRIAAEAERMGMVFPAEQVRLTVDWNVAPDPEPEYRWAQLKVLLTAQP